MDIKGKRLRLLYPDVHGLERGKYLFGEKKKSSQPFKKGETFLIPAKIGEYDIVSQGATEIVVSYVE